jgi:hypothetical protein
MKKVIVLALALVVGIALVYNNWRQRAEREQQALQLPANQELPATTEETPEPAIRFPVPEVQPQEEEHEAGQVTEQLDTESTEDEQPQTEIPKPLPLLDESDDEMRSVLTSLVGQKNLVEFFDPKDIIRHIVVTIDNLPRKQYATKFLPTKPVAGRFVVTGNEENTFISTANYRRYIPYVDLLESLDVKTVVAIYARLYPLFQEAYENLGYPSAYFNDRLIDVIDNLLDTPDKKGLVQLKQPHVLYEYADKDLESLSSGQKILMRMGSDNAVRVKAKLREFRHELSSGRTGE